MSKAILKYYFIGASILAVAIVFMFHAYNGIYSQEVAYICTTIVSTSTLYAYLLNKETFGQIVSKEIGITFLALVTLWFLVLLVLLLWRATDFFSSPIDRDDLSYYFAGLEAFRALILSTMMPKIFPDR